MKVIIFCMFSVFVTVGGYSFELPCEPNPKADSGYNYFEPLNSETSRFSELLIDSSTVAPSEKTLRGIVLFSNASYLQRINRHDVRGIYVDQEVHLSGSVMLLQKKLSPLVLNKEINSSTLLAIKNEILSYFKQCGQRMVFVEIPEQDISSGVVAFKVTQVKIGEITYIGNHWYSKERVKKRLSLEKGQTLDEPAIFNNLSWLNQNPFHYSAAVFSPGKMRGETDIEIVTKDRVPLRVYVGGDNTGVASTGTGRFYGGFTWGDAFFVDDLLTYQFTSNASYHKFHSHSMNYVSFLPWQHSFALYGGYAEIHPDIADFQSNGKNAQASFRYKIPFKPFYTNFQQQLYFGFDYKYITSALFFVAELDFPQAVSNSNVNITQATLGYALDYTPKQHQLAFRVEFFGSPAKWFPHQTNKDYSALRSQAKPRYFYGTLSLGDIYTFSTKDSISVLLRVQGSANVLIPSEQFSLGGYNTVRGYEESVYISDNAICGNLELHTRPLSLLKHAKDKLTFLAFIDYGWGYNYRAFDGIVKTATLWGIGPGLRYSITPKAMFRVDYGFKLHHVGFDDHKLGMWHVGGTLSY